MKRWIKDRLGITALEKRAEVAEAQAKQFDDYVDHLAKQIDKKVKELDHLTREDWDIGARGPSTIILTGVYRGRGFVKFYDVPAEEFRHLVEMFRSREKAHLLRTIDRPYMMDGAFSMR